MARTDGIELLALQQKTDFFETLVRRLYEMTLTAGDTSVDAGANRGGHTVPMAELVGPAGKVHAFEPAPIMAAQLRGAAAGFPQVTVHEVALSHDAGQVDFEFHPDVTGWSTLRHQAWRGPVAIEHITVQAKTLDSLLWQTLRRWRFFKLDVEGAELHAIIGAALSIMRHRPLIVFENGGATTASIFGYTADDWFAVFAALGYVPFNLYGEPTTPENWARHGQPFYAIAAPAGSRDAAFIANDWPAIVDETITEARRPL